MTVQSPILDGSQRARLAGYTDLLALIERLHRMILDVIKPGITAGDALAAADAAEDVHLLV